MSQTAWDKGFINDKVAMLVRRKTTFPRCRQGLAEKATLEDIGFRMRSHPLGTGSRFFSLLLERNRCTQAACAAVLQTDVAAMGTCNRAGYRQA